MQISPYLFFLLSWNFLLTKMNHDKLMKTISAAAPSFLVHLSSVALLSVWSLNSAELNIA